MAVTLEQCWHRVPGGTATAALGTVGALASDGVDVVGVSAWHRREPAEAFRPPVPVRALPLPRPLLYEAWHRRRMPSVERATGPVDVVWASGVAVPPRSAPLLVTINDLAPLHHPEHHPGRSLGFYRRAFELARSEADLVLCPSRATIEDCAAHGFDPGRLRLVPLGADLEPVGEDEVAAVRSRHGLDDPYVLFVGTAEPRKNLSTLVEAVVRLDRPDVTLVLVGPEGWNEDLRALSTRLRSAQLLGFVPTGELRALYAGAAVFCYPSLLEGFGLPVLEAMAQGTPVVTSSGTATEELVEGIGTAVDPRDAGVLADALAAVLDDPAEAARRGEAGRARAAGYSWAATAAGVRAAAEEAGA
jgi:glycosyltransferase involved in cell wall biosynthesis